MRAGTRARYTGRTERYPCAASASKVNHERETLARASLAIKFPRNLVIYYGQGTEFDRPIHVPSDGAPRKAQR